jgi:ADP-ribosyl-[dinitrogen reductase] hydrolase
MMGEVDAILSVASRLRRYSYLMPMASREMQRKVASGTPLGDISTATNDVAESLVADANWAEPSPEVALDRARGCLLGNAIAEVVLAPGECWETTMALFMADSLLESATVDQYDFMIRMANWLGYDGNTVYSWYQPGNTIYDAIKSFIATDNPSAGQSGNSNGSLVRLAPVAIAYRKDLDTASDMAIKQSRTTHANRECLDACKLFVSILLDGLSGANTNEALRPRVMSLSPNILFINAGEWREKPIEEIFPDDNVVHTLEAAIWAVGTTDDFRSAVLKATNLDGATSALIAVTGQLAGAVYGASSIPAEWLVTLKSRENIQYKAEQLFNLEPY